MISTANSLVACGRDSGLMLHKARLLGTAPAVFTPTEYSELSAEAHAGVS